MTNGFQFNFGQFNQKQFNENLDQAANPGWSGHMFRAFEPKLSLTVNGNDWSNETTWTKAQLTGREGLGYAGTFFLNVSDFLTSLVKPPPPASAVFTIQLPNEEKIVMTPDGEPDTLYASDGQKVIGYTYHLIDVVTALDRIPLPQKEYIDYYAGEIIRDILSIMAPSIDTTGVADGNLVPYLDTKEFTRLSDVVRAQAIGTGGYVLFIDPHVNNGVAARGNYKDNFGASGISVDKTSPDFSPLTKDLITPDNDIINYQVVRGSAKGAPDHTVCELRDLAALNGSFKLGGIPFGLEDNELLSVNFDGGSITGTTADLPKVIPLHYPTKIEISDIVLGGSGEVCAFTGRGGVTVLSCLISGSSIGAKIGGVSTTLTTPFAGPGPDANHKYWYTWVAEFQPTGILVRVVESYLNALAPSTAYATVTGVAGNVLTLAFTGGHTMADLPAEVKFFTGGGTIGYATITNRDYTAGTITVSTVPPGVNGSSVAPQLEDVIVTEQTISGASPATKYGKPVLVKSGGGGISATAWTASYGPAIQAALINPTTGALIRHLLVNTNSNGLTDLVVTSSGGAAIATWVKGRVPNEGELMVILNYDEAKQSEYIAINQPSIDVYGYRQGEIINNELAVTVADCQFIGDSVVDEFAFPKPKGTIERESMYLTRMPIPGELVHVDVPTEYRILTADVPITELSIEFPGGDAYLGEGVVRYHITVGHIDRIEDAQRVLLAREQSTGTRFQELLAAGPRITGGSWNNLDTTVVGVSGSITLSGKAASATFNPANFATGDLKSAPVFLAGSIDVGDGKTHELYVELIYPPDGVAPGSELCDYSAETNMVTFTWPKPKGGGFYNIERKKKDGTWELVDQIFAEVYMLPYEPLSKSIRVQTVGLADKTSGDFVELTCNLPALPAPTPFDVVKVKKNDRIIMRCGPPPTGDHISGRAETLRILVFTHDDTVPAATGRADFPDDDDRCVTFNFDVRGWTDTQRIKVEFDDTDKDDIVDVIAFYIDRFGDEGTPTIPFDATRPPMTVGSITAPTFFRTPNPAGPLTNQAAGGTIEDDNELTSQIDFSGQFRYLLGRHNTWVQLFFQEAQPTADSSVGAWITDKKIHSTKWDITDTDVVNGYVDVYVPQKFRYAKKKRRYYRIVEIRIGGPEVRERIGTDEVFTRQVKYLIGNDTGTGTVVDYQADGFFDWDLFNFQPGIGGLINNYDDVATVKIEQVQNGFKFKVRRFDDSSLRRFIFLLHTANFGTNGPGDDFNIDAALDVFVGEGQLTVFNPANTLRNVVVQAKDIGDGHEYIFVNGETFGALTLAAGTEYWVSAIAQKKNGRWGHHFSAPVSSISGRPFGVEPTAAPSTPMSTDVLKNAAYTETVVADAAVSFRVWASHADHTKTFKDVGATDAYAVYRPTSDADGTQPIKIGGPVDPLATHAIFQAILSLGQGFTWIRNETSNAAGKTDSVTANFSFFAGGSNNLALLTLSAITVAAQNSHYSLVSIDVTQPAGAVLYKKVKIGQKKSSDPTYDTVEVRHMLDEEAFFVGSSVNTLKFLVKHKPSTSYDYQITFVAVGGGTRSVTTTGATTSTNETNAVPGALNFPGALTVNTVDGDPEKANARVVVTLATTDTGTFTANNIKMLAVLLARRNEADTAFLDSGNRPYTFQKVLSEAELALNSVQLEFNQKIGQRFGIFAVEAVNGDKKTETTGLLTFRAGGVINIDPADSKTVPAPTFGTITRLDGSNKEDVVPVTLTQNGVDIIFFKSLVVEKSINGSAWFPEYEINLKKEDALYTAVNSSKTFNLPIKRKANATAQYRATAYAVGGKASSTTTTAAQGATTADAPTDTSAAGVPTLSVQEWYGGFYVTPSIGTNSVTRMVYDIAMSTSASAPDVNPGAVVKQFTNVTGPVDFHRRTDITQLLFFHCRAQNAAVGTWSAWVSSAGFTPSRPIEDFIGTAVINIAALTAFDLTYSDTNQQVPVANGPMRITQQQADNGQWFDLVEFQVPTGANAFSITDVEIEVYTGGGSLKYKQPLQYRPGIYFSFIPVTSGKRSVRIRFRNMFRGGGSDGWSAWSNYAAAPIDPGTGGVSSVPYNPANSVVGDLESRGNYPNPYSTY